ncbi:MAG: hypothetical protein ACO38P_02695, partial [Phycisphaerales bacterium]
MPSPFTPGLASRAVAVFIARLAVSIELDRVEKPRRLVAGEPTAPRGGSLPMARRLRAMRRSHEDRSVRVGVFGAT